MNLFQKANANLPLSPGQRAFLKLLQGFALTALISGLLAAAEYLAGNGVIDWQRLLIVVLAQAALAVGHAVAKYFTAQGDQAPLGSAIEAVIEAIESRFSTHHQQEEPAPDSIPPPTPAA